MLPSHNLRTLLFVTLTLCVALAGNRASAQFASHHHPLRHLAAPDAVGLVRLDMAVVRDQGMLDLLAPPVGDATGEEAVKRAAARSIAENATEVLLTILDGTGDEPPVVAIVRGNFQNVTLPPLSGGATEVTYRGFRLRAHDGVLGGLIGSQTFVMGDPAGVRDVVNRLTERERASGVTHTELVQLADAVNLYTAPMAAAMRVTTALRGELPEPLSESGQVSSVGFQATFAGPNLNVQLSVTYASPAEASGFARQGTAALRQIRRSPEVRAMGIGALLGSIRLRARANVASVTARIRAADRAALLALAAAGQ